MQQRKITWCYECKEQGNPPVPEGVERACLEKRLLYKETKESAGWRVEGEERYPGRYHMRMLCAKKAWDHGRLEIKQTRIQTQCGSEARWGQGRWVWMIPWTPNTWLLNGFMKVWVFRTVLDAWSLGKMVPNWVRAFPCTQNSGVKCQSHECEQGAKKIWKQYARLYFWVISSREASSCSFSVGRCHFV